VKLRRYVSLLFALPSSIAWAQYVGVKVCAGCHADIGKTQALSAHARSLARIGEHALAEKLVPLVAARKPAVEWAFGGGSQAVTFVSQVGEDAYLEHHLSYYSSLGRLGTTPGHAGKPEPGVLYRGFGAGGEILRCFQCHSTGNLKADATARIEPAEAGVRCESCHGPGAVHAKAPTAANIINPKRYSANEMNQMCGSCHRKPAAAGDDTDFGNSWNARHQPLYLSQSRCFRESKGQLTCRTCHDPHSGQAQAGCVSCHATVRHPATVRLAGQDCTACHMPPVRPQEGLSFRNHWIGVYGAGDNLVPVYRAKPAR